MFNNLPPGVSDRMIEEQQGDFIPVDVTFLVFVPRSASKEEVREWLEFELGVYGGMSGKNPLVDFELEAESVSAIEYGE